MPNYKIYSNLVPLNRGVSICFQKKLGIEVLDVVKDTVGDFIALKINYGGKKIILAAFYGPSVYNGDCINQNMIRIENMGEVRFYLLEILI